LGLEYETELEEDEMLPSLFELPRYIPEWPSREEDEETSRMIRKKLEEAMDNRTPEQEEDGTEKELSGD